MKYIIISLFLFSSLYADIPVGYYDSASGLSGESLKLALHNIIDDHTEFTYTYESAFTHWLHDLL